MSRQLFALAAVVGVWASCSKPDARPSAEAPPPATPSALLDPQSPDMRAEAPATYRARFETSAGQFVIEVTRAWAPGGADRLYNLVRHGFFDGSRFFRVIPGFMAQFGLNADPAISARWREATIPDDPVQQHNTRGAMSFATAGANTRTTQVFINFVDNLRLDAMGFAPLGRVVEGMDTVDRLYGGYGEGPNQQLVQTRGNAYLASQFPKLDSIVRATIVTP